MAGQALLSADRLGGLIGSRSSMEQGARLARRHGFLVDLVAGGALLTGCQKAGHIAAVVADLIGMALRAKSFAAGGVQFVGVSDEFRVVVLIVRVTGARTMTGLAAEQNGAVQDGLVRAGLEGCGLVLVAVHADQCSYVITMPWPGGGLVLDRRVCEGKKQHSHEPCGPVVRWAKPWG